jgi:hypothetical protein
MSGLGLPIELDRHIHTEPNSGCWLWAGPYGGRNGQYGRVLFQGRMMPAHRAVMVACDVPMPEGLEPDHLCRTPCCVNPDHLEPVTHQENMLRSDAPPGRNSRKTHCNNGHPLDGENLMISRGKRCCRECYRRWTREWRARNASAA